MIKMAPIRVGVLEYIPLGPMCYYCKWKGHVKTECPALAKKICQNALVAPPRLNDVDLNPDVMGQRRYQMYDITCWLWKGDQLQY